MSRAGRVGGRWLVLEEELELLGAVEGCDHDATDPGLVK
jgi:hypothetical protein